MDQKNIYGVIEDIFSTEVDDLHVVSVFTETKSYHKIAGAQPLLVVAPKGSGKTIVFKNIANHKKDNTFYKSLAECSRLEDLNKLDKSGKRKVAKAMLALFILEVLKENDIEKENIKKILERSHITVGQNLSDSIKRIPDSIHSLSLGVDGIAIERAKDAQLLDLSELSSLFESTPINDDIKAVRQVLESRKYSLLLDDFDKIDEEGGGIELLSAILDVAKSTKLVKFCFAIRKDTWLKLLTGFLLESDKYSPVEISWSSDELGETIYKRLKILDDKKMLTNLPKSLDWHTIFSYENKAGKKNLKNYMADASRKRPRDIIKLFKYILDGAIERGAVVPLPIDEKSLKAASAKLGEEVYLSLNSENFFSKINKSDAAKIFQEIRSAFSNQKREMPYDKFVEIVMPICTGHGLTVDDFTRALFCYGVIGFSYEGNELFDNDADSKITLELIDIKKSQIIFAFIFRDVLKLKNLTGR